MMHQNVAATRLFAADGLHVLTVDGDPDTIAFYEQSSPAAWMTMSDPLDLRDYR